ncbi:MAG: hypothetical protein K1X83_04230 [Oligoflexia bacterium]|nr:hypothetical protein [Oligoflexia bacterium]
MRKPIGLFIIALTVFHASCAAAKTDEEICRQNSSWSSPHVDVQSVEKSGGAFSDRYKVSGTVEGICLAEAGLFENGKLTQRIRLRTAPTLKRYEFSITARLDDVPEIRVYNVNGDRDVYQVQTQTGLRWDNWRWRRHDHRPEPPSRPYPGDRQNYWNDPRHDWEHQNYLSKTR